MSRPVPARARLAIALFVSLPLIGAAAPEPFDPLLAVPQGAMAVVSVGNPTSLYMNALAFLVNADLGMVEEPLTEAVLELFDAEGDEGKQALLDALDPNRRIVLAVYPGAGAGPVPLLFLPLRANISEPERRLAETAIAETMSADGAPVWVDDSYPGYLAARPGTEEIPAYGAAATMDLRRLAAYPTASAAIWIDPRSGLSFLNSATGGLEGLLGSGPSDGLGGELEYWSSEEPRGQAHGESGSSFDPLVDNEAAGTFDPLVDNDAAEAASPPADGEAAGDGQGFEEDYDWDEEGLASGPAEGANGLEGSPSVNGENPLGLPPAVTPGLGAAAKALEDAVAEVAGIELALVVQHDKAWLRFGATPAPGGRLAALAMRAGAGDRGLPYLRYCDSGALASIAWSAPYDWALPFLRSLYEALLPGETLVEAMMAIMDRLGRAAGNEGALSIGIDPSAELVRAIRGSEPEPAEAVRLIARGLGLSVSGAMEVRDRQGFRDAMAESMALADDAAYRELMSKSGISLKIKRSVGVVAGKPYDAFEYLAEPLAGGGMESGEAVAAAGLLSAMARPVYVYDGDKAFIGLGSPKEVEAALPVDGARRRLDSSKAFRALRAGAPADARGLFYLSTENLARLVLRLAPRGQEPLGFNASALAGLLGWFDAGPGSIGAGLGIGAEDIRAAVALASGGGR